MTGGSRDAFATVALVVTWWKIAANVAASAATTTADIEKDKHSEECDVVIRKRRTTKFIN